MTATMVEHNPGVSMFYCPLGYGECENANGCVYPGRCPRKCMVKHDDDLVVHRSDSCGLVEPDRVYRVLS